MSDLLAELASLLRRRDPVPDHVSAAAKAIPEVVDGLRGIDGPAAGRLELLSDSAQPLFDAADVEPARLRAHGAREARTLSFRARGRRVEAEVIADADRTLRVTGMVIDCGGGPVRSVHVRHPGGDRQGRVDRLGCFRVERVPRGPMSLVLTTEHSAPLVADWLLC